MGKAPKIIIEGGPDVAATAALRQGSVTVFGLSDGQGRPAKAVEATILELRHVTDGIYFIHFELADGLTLTISYNPQLGVGAVLNVQ